MSAKTKRKPKKLSQQAIAQKRLADFFAAYDAWAHSPDGCGGDRFDAMVEGRGEIEDLFPTADEEEES